MARAVRSAVTADLRAVADVYRSAGSQGRPPNRAVAKAFGVPLTTANHWVKLARAAGFLPPTSPGRATGVTNPKLVAIAADLRIDVGALEAAVRRVGGDIRLAPR